MTKPSDRLSALGILRSEGIEMYLDGHGQLRSRGRVTDSEIADWIRSVRLHIIAELRAERGSDKHANDQ